MVELLSAGHNVVIVDNLVNSKVSVVERICHITSRRPLFVRADIRDRVVLSKLFEQHKFAAVIHFAGLKAVGESVQKPLAYYDNNVSGTIALTEVMSAFNVKTLVFSSSATVYGSPHVARIKEDFPLAPANPYGRSKLMVEDILRDLFRADGEWRIALLRYFNPVGAHSTGLLGEDPNGVPNNLLPFVTQVAAGMRPYLSIFGGDYATPDGTGIRDYVHVEDLAGGHIAALHALATRKGVLTVNLGTGRGYSVLEVVRTFAETTGRAVPYRVVGRRPGDVPENFADPSLAGELLGWRASRGLREMCGDAWRWQSTVLKV